MKTSLATLMLTAAVALPAETYRDPQQRFQLEVPAGWTAQSFGKGVNFVKGGSYMLVMDGAGAGPAMLDRWTGQFTSQWSNTQEIKSGNATLDGQPAAYRLLSGVNPKGVSSFLKITVAQAVVMVAACPENEFAATKPVFERMERSFMMAGGAPQGPAGGYGAESDNGGYGQNPGPAGRGSGAYGQGGYGQGGYGGGYGQNGPGGSNGGYGQGGYQGGNPGGGYGGGYPGGQYGGGYGPGGPPAGSAFAGLALRDAGPGQPGAVVEMVAPNSPAAQAGIQPGDRILAVNRNPVRSGSDVPAAVMASRPGDILELAVSRNNGQPQVIKLKLAARQ